MTRRSKRTISRRSWLLGESTFDLELTFLNTYLFTHYLNISSKHHHHGILYCNVHHHCFVFRCFVLLVVQIERYAVWSELDEPPSVQCKASFKSTLHGAQTGRYRVCVCGQSIHFDLASGHQICSY